MGGWGREFEYLTVWCTVQYSTRDEETLSRLQFGGRGEEEEEMGVDT